MYVFFSGRNVPAKSEPPPNSGKLRPEKKMYSHLAGNVFQQVAFVLLLIEVDLIHFEHTKCISKLQSKLIHIRYI